MSGPAVTFTRAGLLRGARQAAPLVIGTFPFGLVVGVISDAKGLSLLETLLMSALVFAGSSQLLALELWTEPAPIAAATLAAFVVNIRLAPMGAALAPWLDRLRGVRLWGSLATLVDHSYALSAADQRRGGRDAAFLLGVGVALWTFWMIAVGVGHVFGSAVRLPPGHPLYFAATATFCAILVPIWQGVRRDMLPWTLAGIVALLAWGAGLGPPWPLLAGALCGAALGAWLELRRG
ncbi:AzlC family ABC transporter permease [Roseomonas sp. PWR1]|uniref:AzlC family ABC transporter permease n=1 Tax=Roseomonas nitratireducens TaxID=2820810 RepID=A0ABS4AMY2_9PROT|nr:AzlC family ABC transporter permease [Neoroseomonas nitratireducens]MBP0462725.1 AzlC family ABC transporter permease [Neoroseomonas nitratireducens]